MIFELQPARGARRLPAFAALILGFALIASCSGSVGSPLATVPVNVPSMEGHSLKYRVLFSFGNSAYGYDGAGPVARLIYVTGRLYGTTEYGGVSNDGGTVFTVTTTGSGERVLYSFTSRSPSGSGGPVAGLVAVGDTLYGTTAGEGTYNAGTVFSINANGSSERVLHNFGQGSDGANPRGDLLFVNGKLYGTTYQGGVQGKGTVFSVSITNGAEHVLHSFGNGSDGAYPVAGLVNVSGALYGTTEFGGSGDGTVFNISPVGAETTLYSFGGLDGAYPMASLVDVNGALYGTTAGGGQAADGTVFGINTAGTNERVLHSFSNNNSDGVAPVAGVIAVNGELYGTTFEGGAAGKGTVFRVNINGKERVLHSFTIDYQNDGLNPEAALVDVRNMLYGTTYQGGISLPSCPVSGGLCDWGTVFALTP